jgi:hypothetical protein
MHEKLIVADFVKKYSASESSLQCSRDLAIVPFAEALQPKSHTHARL